MVVAGTGDTGRGSPVRPIGSRSPPGRCGPDRVGAHARGSYPIPAFMPVGTRGAVKALDSADLDALGAEVVLANTYHLMLRPGADVVAGLGGLHRFIGLVRPHPHRLGRLPGALARPGGRRRGVTFASVYDGAASDSPRSRPSRPRA